MKFQFKILLFSLCILNFSSAWASWTKVADCDGSQLVIDHSDASSPADVSPYQMVLRGNVVYWIVHQANLLSATRVNEKGEIIQQNNLSSQFGGYRYFTFETDNPPNEVKLSLQNFPPRLEAQAYDPRFGNIGGGQVYYFNHCDM